MPIPREPYIRVIEIYNIVSLNHKHKCAYLVSQDKRTIRYSPEIYELVKDLDVKGLRAVQKINLKTNEIGYTITSPPGLIPPEYDGRGKTDE